MVEPTKYVRLCFLLIPCCAIPFLNETGQISGILTVNIPIYSEITKISEPQLSLWIFLGYLCRNLWYLSYISAIIYADIQMKIYIAIKYSSWWGCTWSKFFHDLCKCLWIIWILHWIPVWRSHRIFFERSDWKCQTIEFPSSLCNYKTGLL